MKDKKVVYKKLNQDDILEILVEHFYDGELEGYCKARAGLLGTPDKDLRFIGAFGVEESKEIFNININEIDKKIDFNGDHSYFSKHPEALLKSLPKDESKK